MPRHQITALIGLNGSGKTTLLFTVLKEIRYTGEIRFHCGHDHHQPAPQYVGYVPQKLTFDANLPLTVRDLLALALQRRPLFLGISRRVERTMLAMLESVGVPAPPGHAGQSGRQNLRRRVTTRVDGPGVTTETGIAAAR